MAVLKTLTSTFVKTSWPVFLVTLLVTSQVRNGVKAREAEECCDCGEISSLMAAGAAGAATFFGGTFLARYLGAEEEGIKKGSAAARMMQASSLSGLGGKVVSNVQKAGTKSGAWKTSATAAGEAYRAAKNRCCACH